MSYFVTTGTLHEIAILADVDTPEDAERLARAGSVEAGEVIECPRVEPRPIYED
jgi:hypothetical protein